MNKKRWRIRQGLLCLMFAALVGLSGCREDMEIKLTTGLNVGDLFQIENKPCTLSEARLFLMNQKNRYEASYGLNIWAVPVGDGEFADYMKTELQDFLIRLKTMALMAEKQGIVLSEEDESRAVAAAAEYMDGLNTEAAAYTQITQEQTENLYREYRLAELLVSQLTEGINEEISDDAARVIEVQQVVLQKVVQQTEETESTQAGGQSAAETKAAAQERDQKALREQAEEIARLAAQGEVFVNLQEVYSDEPTGNIRVSRYDVEPEWEEAVFSLAPGEVSGVIETSEAFYVVRCVNNMLVSETQANKEVIRERQRASVFFEAYRDFSAGLQSMWDEESWKKCNFTEEVPECSVDFYAIYEQYFE